MSITLALSDGTTKKDFEAGAVRYPYCRNASLGLCVLVMSLGSAMPAGALAGQMIVSDRESSLAVNAWDGAKHGAILTLHNACQPSNPDCTWTYRDGMLISDKDPTLAINAWDGAKHGAILKLHNACQPSNPDCTWTYRNGMWISDRDSTLAINAWDGAKHGTVLRLHNACQPGNADCTWRPAPVQGCKFQAATSGKPPTCVGRGSTGNCSPVDSGAGWTGTCKVLVGGEECTCEGSAKTTPPPTPLPTPDSAPLTGFVDLHTHPLANLGFGGKLIYGGMDVGAYLPADPDCNLYVHATSEQQALGHDESTHGGRNFLNPFYNQCGDNIREQIIHAVQSLNNGADPNGSSSGYPDFPDWPVWKDLTHQKMWVEWIRRSYAGNLRVMVALAVNNQTLGDAVIGPGDTLPTDDKGSADLQILEIKSFVGRHADFMEVAYSSADVYRIVSANKLAVVIGIEIDNIGNLNKATQPPTNAAISGEIDRLFAEGVRYIFPIHLLDNAFGGTAVYEDLFNFSTFREDGHYWNLRCAPPPSPANSSEAINYKFTSHTVQEITLLDIASTIKLRTTFPLPPTYPQCGQANSAGLTSQGRFALNEMMRHGLLIDVDHMSQAAADETLAIAKEIAYPINSGHNGLRGALPDNHNERALRADQYTAIGTLHGMAGVGSGGLDASTWLTLYNQVMTAMALGGGSVVGAFGTDTNGVAPGMPPRLGYGQKECIADCDCTSDLGAKAKAKCLKTCAAGCRKRFPNVVNGAAEGASAVQYSKAFPASADGNKTWNYNVVGVAHYGMLPDFLQDVKSLPEGATMVEGFMTGADYFYRTWKIAEEKKALVK